MDELSYKQQYTEAFNMLMDTIVESELPALSKQRLLREFKIEINTIIDNLR